MFLALLFATMLAAFLGGYGLGYGLVLLIVVAKIVWWFYWWLPMCDVWLTPTGVLVELAKTEELVPFGDIAHVEYRPLPWSLGAVVVRRKSGSGTSEFRFRPKFAESFRLQPLQEPRCVAQLRALAAGQGQVSGA